VAPLTTADVPREAIGRLICEALLATGGAGSPAPGESVVETRLIVRESTARPPEERSPERSPERAGDLPRRAKRR
jgi:DNA-binding LacI/PurR family transcriptional regulator